MSASFLPSKGSLEAFIIDQQSEAYSVVIDYRNWLISVFRPKQAR